MFERVFGRDGLLRRSDSTVILSTHSGECFRIQRGRTRYLTSVAVRHLPSADDIIALGQNGAIFEQGSFDKLKTAGGYVQSLGVAAGTSGSNIDVVEHKAESQLTMRLTAATLDTDDLQQKTDASVWMYYARALGWVRIASFVLLLAISAGFESFRCQYNLPTTSSYVFTEVELKRERTDVWLTWWASTDGTEASGRLGYWLGIYGTLGVIEVSAMAGVVLWVAKQGRRNTACIPR